MIRPRPSSEIVATSAPALGERQPRMLPWPHQLTITTSHELRRGVIGIGIVIRERREDGRLGPVVLRLSEAHRGTFVDDPEAFAVMRSLEVALQHGITRLQVRSNYHPRRNRRLDRRDRAAPPDPVQSRLRDLTALFVSVTFGAVKRQGEALPRRLARDARVSALSAIAAGRRRRGGERSSGEPDLHPHVEDLAEDDLLDERLPGDIQDDAEVPF